jgi:hypothetical protein
MYKKIGNIDKLNKMMYQQMASSNTLVNNFNAHVSNNSKHVPFRSNQLMTENVHVVNHLNENMHQKRIDQQNRKSQTYFPEESNQKSRSKINKSVDNNNNIIKELLKSEKIEKNNKDVKSNFNNRLNEFEKGKQLDPINQPYKIILKDKIINKHWKEIRDAGKEELVVHTVSDKDKDIHVFTKQSAVKENELNKINDEIEIEFHIDNYDRNKKNYEYKETLIKNYSHEAKTGNENKDDYIEFYKKKQKEAEKDSKLCDSILNKLLDTGLIDPKELPSGLVDDIKNSPMEKTVEDSSQQTEIIFQENHKTSISELLAPNPIKVSNTKQTEESKSNDLNSLSDLLRQKDSRTKPIEEYKSNDLNSLSDLLRQKDSRTKSMNNIHNDDKLNSLSDLLRQKKYGKK